MHHSEKEFDSCASLFNMSLTVLVQNLEKQAGLASALIDKYNPDLFLAQEISISSEVVTFQAHSVSRRGYGTAIYSKQKQLSNIRTLLSPHAENIPFIVKKTTIANLENIQLVTIHAYNGWPTKKVEYLVDHIVAVLSSLEAGPVLFAGDFNTWTEAHVKAVRDTMAESGFDLAYSWPYPGRDIPLDHAFTRGVNVSNCSFFKSESDHQGALFTLHL